MLETIIAYFSSFTAPISIMDIIIVLVFCFYAYEGFSIGVTQSLLDLGSFILSFILALKSYGTVAILLIKLFSLPSGFANAIGFFIAALVLEIFFNILFRKLYSLLPTPSSENRFYIFYKKIDHLLGIVPGFVSSGTILAFLLSVVIALPSSPLLKQAVDNSKIGSFLVSNTAFVEKELNSVFGGALHDSLNFFTVEPQSNETVQLHFTVLNGTVDAVAEKEMLLLLNKERTSRGLTALTVGEPLVDLARAYSDDMLKNGYFSHYNTKGQSPFERMDESQISYTYAGENLALAPTTQLAMQGLMNSPGHKANILKPEFRKIGIGVIDGGIYGKMFTQEFTD